MTTEPEDIAELQARVDGLQAVLSVALNLMPQNQVLDRLKALERLFRSQNARSGVIEVVREFREIWETRPP